MEVRWNPRAGTQHESTPASTTASTTAATTNTNSSSTEPPDWFLYYDPDYKVLICKEHGYAIRNLRLHLRDYHSIRQKIQKEIVKKYSEYALLGPRDVLLPPPFGPPFEILRKPMDAFLCDEEECRFISINRDGVRKHSKKMHGWKSTRQDREHWTSVKVQTFFASSGFQRYFTVHVPEPEGEAASRADNEGDEEFVQAMLSEWKKADEDYEKGLEVADAEVAKTDRTGWYSRTGWPEHMAKRNLTYLAHARRLPDRDEKELKQVCSVVDMLIERCVSGLSTLAHETRRWLRSAKREEVDVRPMGRLENADSQERYTGYWQQFICYCLRLIAAEEAEGDNNALSGDIDNNEDGSSENADSTTGGINENSDDDSGDDGEGVENGENDEDNARFLRDARELFRWRDEQKELAKDLWYAL